MTDNQSSIGQQGHHNQATSGQIQALEKNNSLGTDFCGANENQWKWLSVEKIRAIAEENKRKELKSSQCEKACSIYGP